MMLKHRFSIIMNRALLLGLGLALSACSAHTTEREQANRPSRVQDRPHTATPLVPSETTPPVQGQATGLASWYGPGFHGRLTANGETFDQSQLTAAHLTLPFNTQVRVTRFDNGQSIIVRINDRGPYVEGRIIDLSEAAARALGFIEEGVVEVLVEDLGPIDPKDRAARSVFFDPSDGPPRAPSREGESH